MPVIRSTAAYLPIKVGIPEAIRLIISISSLLALALPWHAARMKQPIAIIVAVGVVGQRTASQVALNALCVLNGLIGKPAWHMHHVGVQTGMLLGR